MSLFCRRYVKAFAPVLLALAAVLTTGCEEAVDFTERPPETVRETANKPDLTPVFITRRVALADLETDLADAVPSSFGNVRRTDWEVLCEKRTVRVRRGRRGHRFTRTRVRRICHGARITGEIRRDGPARITEAGGTLQFEVPLAYHFTVQGRGDAKEKQASLEGKRWVRARIDVVFDEEWKAAAHISDAFTWSEPPVVEALGGKFSFAGTVTGVLKRRLGSLAQKIQEALAQNSLKVRELAAQAWRHLHYPVQLMEEPAIWMRGEPEALKLAGFAIRNNALELRIAIMTRLKTYVGERPVPLLSVPLPVLSSEPPEVARSHLAMPALVSYDEIAAAAASQIASGTALQLDRLPEDVVVKVTGFEVFPTSAGRIAIGVGLDVALPERWGSIVGKAWLIARPVVHKGEMVLRLAHPRLVKPGSTPMLYRGGRFLLAGRGFTEAIAKAVTVDLGARFKKALSQANAATSRRFSDRLWLAGAFDEVEVAAIDTLRDGLRINLSLVGELAIRAESAPATTGALTR